MHALLNVSSHTECLLVSVNHRHWVRFPARASKSESQKGSCLKGHVSILAFGRVFGHVFGDFHLGLLGRRLLVVIFVVALSSFLTDSFRSSSLLLAATALSNRSGRSIRISSLAGGSLALCGAASRSRRVGAGSLGGGRQRSELFIVVLTR